MPFDPISHIAGKFVDFLLDLAKREVLRDADVVLFLKKHGIEKLEDNFENIYMNTIAVIALVGKPQAVLRLFQDKHVVQAFAEAWQRDDPIVFSSEARQAVEELAAGDEIKRLGIQVSSEIDRFQAMFRKLVQQARTPGEQEVSTRLDRLLVEVKKLQPIPDPLINKKNELQGLEHQTNEYLESTRRQLEFLDFGGIAPRIQNRIVKIRLADIFIPIMARPQLERRVPLPGDMTEFLKSCVPWDRVKPSDEIISQLDPRIRHYFRRARKIADIRTRLIDIGYEVPNIDISRADPGRPVDILELIQGDRVVILGDPGSGKSTLLKYIAYAVASRVAGYLNPRILSRLPILVRLSEFAKARRANPTMSLRRFITFEINPEKSPLFQHQLDAGLCLLLLDGLDEVINAYERVELTNQINQLAADLPAIQIVMTSRIVGYSPGRLVGTFKHFTLEKISQQAVSTFAEKWFAAIEELPENSLETQNAVLRSQNLTRAIYSNPGITRLAENPLLLTIVALVFWRGRKLPSRRIELYEHAAETLIESWPFTQRGVRMDTERVSAILAHVAYRIFASRSAGDISETELYPIVIDALIETHAIARKEAQVLGKDFLQQITEQSGIFVERGIDETGSRHFGFLHLTFAEYFAARFLSSKWRSTPTFDLATFARNPRWREVFLLMVGYIGLRDEVSATKILADLLELADEWPMLARTWLLIADVMADDLRVQPQAAKYVAQEICNLYLETSIEQVRVLLGTALSRLTGTIYSDPMVSCLHERQQGNEKGLRGYISLALAVLGDSDVANSLIMQLESSSHGVRMNLIKALSQNPTYEVTQHLLAAYERYHNRARNTKGVERANLESAMSAILGILGNYRDRAATESVVSLVVQHRLRNSQAAHTLKQIGSDRVIALLLEHLEKDVETVAYLLGHLNDGRCVPPLLEKLQSLEHLASETESDSTRRNINGDIQVIIEALGYIGDPRSTIHLLRLLDYSDNSVRIAAASALGRTKDTTAVGSLLEKLQSRSAQSQRHIIDALVEIGDRQSTDVIVGYLAPEYPADARIAAAKGVGQLGNTSLVPRLLKYCRDSDEYVRSKVVESLGMLADPIAVDCVSQSLYLERWDHRGIAALALVRIGDTRGIELLISLLHRPDWGGRRLTVMALSQIDDPIVTNAIIQLLEDSDWVVRRAAAAALSKMSSAEVVDALIRHLNDPDKQVQQVIVESLGILGDPLAAKPLLQLWRNGALPDDVAIEALGNLGEPEALPFLVQHLNKGEAFEAMISILNAHAAEPDTTVMHTHTVSGPWETLNRCL